MHKLSRMTALIGVAGLTATALLVAAGPASAAVVGPTNTVQHPGALHFSTNGGDGTDTPTWSTDNGCPAGDTVANLYITSSGGAPQKITGNISNVGSPINAPFNTSTFTGTAIAAASIGQGDSMGLIPGDIGGTIPNTYQFLLGCSVGAAAPDNLVADAYVTYTASGSWTYSATSTVTDNRPAATVHVDSLTAVDSGSPATLSASIDATAKGTLVFSSDGTAVAPAVTVTPPTGGHVTETVTTGAAPFTSGTHNITAVFTADADSPVKGGSDAAGSGLVVNPVAGSFGENVTVTVQPEEGAFTYTVGTGTVQLLATSGTNGHAGSFGSGTFNYTGQMNPVTVTDLRTQSAPGWHVDGAVTDFTGSGTANGKTIPGSDLGWVPAVITQDPGNDVVAGAAIAAGTVPGLGGVFTGVNPHDGTGGVSTPGGGKLAGAPATKGLQQSVLGGALNLTVPDSTTAGGYNATLTFTAITTG